MDIMDIAIAKALSGGGGGGGGDSSVFVVKFSMDTNMNVTADKTFTEVVNACESGMCVIGILCDNAGRSTASLTSQALFTEGEITDVDFYTVCPSVDNFSIVALSSFGVQFTEDSLVLDYGEAILQS